MPSQLPDRPDLEFLKNQAKALLTSLRKLDPDALTRAKTLGFAAPFKLAHVQSILAKEYGFPSWAKLKRHVESHVGRLEAFFAAIRAGERERVAALLDEDPGLIRANAPQDFDAPAINLAANRNDIPMIDLLLDRGADIDARSTWWAGGFGALDLANEATSRHLLQRGATLTPHAAARLGLADELRTILSKNPEAVHQRGGDGAFPLHFSKTPEIVDLLVDAGAELDARDIDHEGTALQFKVREASVRDRLLERGATPDIFTAVERDDPAMVEQFLEEDSTNADRRPSDPGNPWIPKAPGGHIYQYVIGDRLPHQVAHNHVKKLAWQILFDHAAPSRRLGMAAWKADADLAEEILRQEPDAAQHLATSDVRMLGGAAWDRHPRAVKLMLELGWPIDLADEEAMTPLMRAAFHGFDDIVELILPHRPNLLQRNVYGGDALGTCLYGSLHGWRHDGNHARTVELLLEAGIERPKDFVGSPTVMEVLARFGVR